MTTYLTLGASLFGLMAVLTLIFATASRMGGVWILGHDYSTGDVLLKRLKPSRDNAVRFKKPGGATCKIILNGKWRRRYKGAPLYEADVTDGQGRLMLTQRSGEVLRTDGFRLDAAYVSHAIKTSNQTASADFNRLAMYALIGLISLAVIMIGGIAYILKAINQTGVA